MEFETFFRPVGTPINVPPEALGTAAESDINSLVHNVRNILDRADADQAALTKRYIEAGRQLWKIKRVCDHGDFGELAGAFLSRTFTLHAPRVYDFGEGL